MKNKKILIKIAKENPLYRKAILEYEKNGPLNLGPLTSKKMIEDPQYVMFQMSRYKHACSRPRVNTFCFSQTIIFVTFSRAISSNRLYNKW